MMVDASGAYVEAYLGACYPSSAGALCALALAFGTPSSFVQWTLSAGSKVSVAQNLASDVSLVSSPVTYLIL